MQETFETFITQERDRLTKKREDVLSRRAELDRELSEIDREFTAIQAYEQAKKGTPTRTRRGSKRTEVLHVINSHPEGLSRAQILEAMNVKGDKKGEQSVSNSLTALKKAGNIDQRDGKYVTV